MFRLMSPDRARSTYLSQREMSSLVRNREWLERLAKAMECGLVSQEDAQVMVVERIESARRLRWAPSAA